MWLWWLSMAWALDCEAPVPLGELEATLGEAEQAYVDFDDVLFRDKVNIAAGILLPCVGDALPAATASRFHQVTALHLFTIGDEANAALAIQAARAVDPRWLRLDRGRLTLPIASKSASKAAVKTDAVTCPRTI